MWLVLAEVGDWAATWAAEGLWQRGLRPLRLVTGAELAGGVVWEHRLDWSGAHTRLVLTDGTPVVDGEVRGVLNRLTGLYSPPGRVAESDAEYAACEYNALLLSFLAALPCPVVNRPGSIGGAAGALSLPQWLRAARLAGLPVLPWHSDEPFWGPSPRLPPGARARTVFAVDGEIADGRDLDLRTVAACRRLSRRQGAAILAIELVCRDGAPPRFAAASRLPDLREGGPALLDLVARALT